MRHLFLFIMLGIFLLRALGFFSKRGNLRPPATAKPAPPRISDLLRPSAPVTSAPSEPFSGEPTRDPLGGWDRGVLRLAVTVGWVLGYALLWSCLFGLPQLQQVPASLRVAAGLIGSVLIVAVARWILAGVESTQTAGQNPIR